MVRYIYGVFEGSLRFLGKWAFPLGLILLIALGVTAILAIVLYRINNEAYQGAARSLNRGLRKFGVGIFLIAFILLQMNFLKAVREGVITRINQASSARYTTEGDSGGGETIQFVPAVTYSQRETRQQRLILPKYTLNYINAQGLNNASALNAFPGWSPEELRYDTRPIINVEDQLEKNDNAIVINRTFTVDRFMPLKLKSSEINLKLTFKDQGNRARRQYYQADFRGCYSFINSLPEKRLFHFSFPLPQSSGTLSNFRFKVDGKDYPVQDVSRGYEWTGEVEPNKSVTIEVIYSHSGSRSWTYNLSYKREAISDFKLQVESNNPHIKFQRGALPPSKRTKGLMGATALTWELTNLITSQDISLYFPSISKSEQITRMYIFSPLALVGFVLMLMGWAHVKRFELNASHIILSTLSYSGSFALTAYLMTYMPLALAVFISFAMGYGLTMIILGGPMKRQMLLPAAVFALLPLTFIAVGNTGFLLCIIGFAVIGAFACEMGVFAKPLAAAEEASTQPMKE
jgi:hypothetical protein